MSTQPSTATKQKNEATRKRKPQPTQDSITRKPSEFVGLGAIQAGMLDPQSASRKTLRGAQRAYGNQHVQRATRRTSVQRAMTVNDPNDKFEKEADSVAETLHRKTATPAAPNAPSDSGGAGDSHTDSTAQRSAEAKPPTRTPTPPTSDTPSNVPLQRSTAPVKAAAPATAPLIQRAMTVNNPNDKFEQEADAVADTLHRKPEHVPPVGGDDSGGSGGDTGGGDTGGSDAGGAPGGGGSTGSGDDGGNNIKRSSSAEATSSNAGGATTVQQKTVRRMVPNKLSGALFQSKPETSDVQKVDSAEEETVMASPATPQFVPPFAENGSDNSAQRNTAVQRSNNLGMDSEGNVHSDVESQINRKRGGGEPLSTPIQRQMESHLGNDLSSVRVHTDSHSDKLSRSLQAEAFTTGNDVFFSRDSYNPGSAKGQKLIAHELTHVVQQGASRPLSAQRRAEIQREHKKNEGVARKPQQANNTPTVSRNNDSTSVQLKEKRDKKKGAEEFRKAQAALSAQQQSGSAHSDDGNQHEPQVQPSNTGSHGGTSTAPAAPPERPKPGPVTGKPNVTASDVQDIIDETPAGDADTGPLGWAPTKQNTIPDWDDEVQKFEAFKKGDFSSMGFDLSKVKGNFMGIDKKITVDDPSKRAQMAYDALNFDPTKKSKNYNAKRAAITGDMPATAVADVTKATLKTSPKNWFGLKGVGSGFANTGKNWWRAAKGMFSGSKFNKIASVLELIIATIGFVTQILRALIVFGNLIYWVCNWIYKLAKKWDWVPGSGLAMAFGTAGMGLALTFNAAVMLLVWAIEQFLKPFRAAAIAFRVIDMMYYETDPKKLMESQQMIEQNVAAINGSSYEAMTYDPTTSGASGVAQKEAKSPGKNKVDGTSVNDPDAHRKKLKPETDADAAERWAQRYGVDTTASQITEKLKEANVKPPPLFEYTHKKKNDIITRIDNAAIAIIEIDRQRYGIHVQRRQIGLTKKTAKTQVKMMGVQRSAIQAGQDAVKIHKGQIAAKKNKQSAMSAKSQLITKGVSKGKTKANSKKVKLTGMSGAILRFLLLLAPYIAKAKKKDSPKKQKKKVKETPAKTTNAANQSLGAALDAQNTADERQAQTSAIEQKAGQSGDKLQQTDDLMAGKQDDVRQGVGQLDNLDSQMQSDSDSLESQKQRLIQERASAINDAITWMSNWRLQRKQLFEEMEGRVAKREDETKVKKDKQVGDLWDAQKDQGKLKGNYIGNQMTTIKDNQPSNNTSGTDTKENVMEGYGDNENAYGDQGDDGYSNNADQY